MNLSLLLIQSNFELHERETHLTSLLLFVVLLCCSVVGAGRINNTSFFSTISAGFFKFKPQDKSFNEGSRISQGAMIALFVNFVISLYLCFFLLFFNGENYNFALISGGLMAFGYLFMHQFGFRLAALFSGQTEISENGAQITRQIWFFAGVLLLLLALFWILNMRYKSVFLLVFIVILITSSILRIARGLLFSFRVRFSWYYIFLYLCTLEILPVIILNKLIQMYLKVSL